MSLGTSFLDAIPENPGSTVLSPTASLWTAFSTYEEYQRPFLDAWRTALRTKSKTSKQVISTRWSAGGCSQGFLPHQDQNIKVTSIPGAPSVRGHRSSCSTLSSSQHQLSAAAAEAVNDARLHQSQHQTRKTGPWNPRRVSKLESLLTREDVASSSAALLLPSITGNSPRSSQLASHTMSNTISLAASWTKHAKCGDAVNYMGLRLEMSGWAPLQS
ncbi:hypothetical protein K402DRAFT_252620 [Aulographum hederae CBS 113979]|uniref:Uncharacterized protein n=1 Tax=Aulographum hederae CBS 113979 TaxID=1176131 RepID=A0A6G1GJV6_9PEZI|nr:hypothetical protein K402DRAFT_252620 [Aulographum hederae CBS 113979]